MMRVLRKEALARDPAHKGKISPKSEHEAEVGISLEESGYLRGPIRRDPAPAGGEFIDVDGVVWDVKSFNSKWPSEKGGFKLSRDLDKIEDELEKGENIILDTTNLSQEHYELLRNAITIRGWADRIRWYPPSLNE